MKTWKRRTCAFARKFVCSVRRGKSKKGYDLLCRPQPMRFAFIDAWKEEWPVEFLCKVMRVTSRGFRAWRVRPMSQHQRPSHAYKHAREGGGRRPSDARERHQDYQDPEIQGGGGSGNDPEDHFPDDGRTATMRSTSLRTCWIRTSLLMVQTKNGQGTSPTSGPARAGCISLSFSIFILGGSSVGPSVIV